jgi:DNA invertase Pin-like site-specific DNA recombinase
VSCRRNGAGAGQQPRPGFSGAAGEAQWLRQGLHALIAEFENDIRRERQQDGINKAKADGVRFGPKPLLTLEVVHKIKELRADGASLPEIMRRMKLSKASVYRALNA